MIQQIRLARPTIPSSPMSAKAMRTSLLGAKYTSDRRNGNQETLQPTGAQGLPEARNPVAEHVPVPDRGRDVNRRGSEVDRRARRVLTRGRDVPPSLLPRRQRPLEKRRQRMEQVQLRHPPVQPVRPPRIHHQLERRPSLL